MNVTQAVLARRSTRDFLPDPVPHELVREVLGLSARAPSGGNLQPWHLDVVAGTALNDLRRHVAAFVRIGSNPTHGMNIRTTEAALPMFRRMWSNITDLTGTPAHAYAKRPRKAIQRSLRKAQSL